MAHIDNNPLELKARLAAAGITLYIKNGRTILRTSRSAQPRRMTRKQFTLRQRMAHNNALWRALKQAGDPRFAGGSSACHRFRSVNTASPAIYLTRDQHLTGATLLLPSMAVSDGSLKAIGYNLRRVGAHPALATDINPSALAGGSCRFYLLRQEEQQEVPRLRVSMCDFDPASPSEKLAEWGIGTLIVDGCLALVGEVFADPMCGFALVRLLGNQASPQRVATQCTYYERFVTEEALLKAAKSYGGLTR